MNVIRPLAIEQGTALDVSILCDECGHQLGTHHLEEASFVRIDGPCGPSFVKSIHRALADVGIEAGWDINKYSDIPKAVCPGCRKQKAEADVD